MEDDLSNTIFYTCLIRNKYEIIAKYATHTGNYDEVLREILEIIHVNGESKMTLNYQNFSFHYIIDDQIVYLCLTKTSFDIQNAFNYLDLIRKIFKASYDNKRIHVALPFSLNKEFSSVIGKEIHAQMRYGNLNLKLKDDNFSFTCERDDYSSIEISLDKKKFILTQNIDHCKTTKRDNKLQISIKKIDDYENDYLATFRYKKHNEARAIFLKNFKLILSTVIACFIVVYLIISISCGELIWKTCA